MELCDRCSARAIQRFVSQDNHTLTFCNHHATKFLVALGNQGFVVQEDELVDV